MDDPNELRYLKPLQIETPKPKKVCWFRKNNIKHVDFKDATFLKYFVNEQGKMLPRRITGVSLKYQKKLSTAIKRARFLALMPYVTDGYSEKPKLKI